MTDIQPTLIFAKFNLSFFSLPADYTRGVKKWWFMMSIKFSLVCLLLHRDVDQRGLCGHHLPLLGAQRRPVLGDQQRALVSCTRPLHSLLLQVGVDQFAFCWFASMSDKISFPFQTKEQSRKRSYLKPSEESKTTSWASSFEPATLQRKEIVSKCSHTK